MGKKIELPKERIPFSTRGTQVHKCVSDYDRSKEKEETLREVEESE